MTTIVTRRDLPNEKAGRTNAMTCSDKLIAFLQSVPLFRKLPARELQYLAEDCQRRTFEEGALIFYEGQRGTTCHIILKGKVRIYTVGEDGKELAMRLLGPGEIIGEMALFEDLPRSANVITLEWTETLELDRAILLELLRRYPDMALGLLKALSARLRHTNEDAEWLASLPVTERLLLQLRRLASWSSSPTSDGVRLLPPMTQHELASLIGTSRESVNRALVRLREEKRVRLENGWIILLDEIPES